MTVPKEMENDLADALLAVLHRHGRTKPEVRAYFASFAAETPLPLFAIADRFSMPVDSFLDEVATEMSARTGARCTPEYRAGGREVLQ